MKISSILVLLSFFIGMSCSSNRDLNYDGMSDEVFIENASESLSNNEGTVFEDDLSPSNLNEQAAKELEDIASHENPLHEYQVQEGDTLMLISFKMYGDYMRWREISELNNLKNHKLQKGELLKYKRPEGAFGWVPEGEPYLIKNADTLGTISFDVYGKSKHWKYIWNNNRPAIKNPNVIYAGFTIYYLPLEESEVEVDRSLASKAKVEEDKI